jgi:hypothetical protein
VVLVAVVAPMLVFGVLPGESVSFGRTERRG